MTDTPLSYMEGMPRIYALADIDNVTVRQQWELMLHYYAREFDPAVPLEQVKKKCVSSPDKIKLGDPKTATLIMVCVNGKLDLEKLVNKFIKSDLDANVAMVFLTPDTVMPWKFGFHVTKALDPSMPASFLFKAADKNALSRSTKIENFVHDKLIEPLFNLIHNGERPLVSIEQQVKRPEEDGGDGGANILRDGRVGPPPVAPSLKGGAPFPPGV